MHVALFLERISISDNSSKLSTTNPVEFLCKCLKWSFSNGDSFQKGGERLIDRMRTLACLLCFVNPSLQYCYKENIRRTSCISHASHVARPRNPRIPIVRSCIQAAFRTRTSIFKSGISGSARQGDMQLKRAIQHATKTLEKMQQH